MFAPLAFPRSVRAASTVLIASLLGLFLLCGPAAANGKAFEELVTTSKSMMMTDPRGALAAAEEAEQLAQRLPAGEREVARACALWLKAEASLRAGLPEEGAPAVKTALAILEGIEGQDALRADLLLARGRIAGRLSETELAARSFFDAHELFVAVGDSRKESIALQAIGSIYRDAESYGQALDYYQRAEDIYDADPAVALAMANNRGNILSEMGRNEEARANFEAAMVLAEEMEAGVLVGRILTNLAGVEVASGNLALARTYARRAHAALSGEQDREWNRFVHGLDAMIALAENRPEEARAAIEQGFAGVDLETTTLSYEEMHATARDIYEALGDWENAFLHQRQHARLADEAKKIAASANLALAGARFQFAEQQLNIERLKNERLQKERELIEADRRGQAQWVVIASGGIVLLFAFLAAGAAWSIKRRVARINEELSATVDLLNAEIEHRELIEADLISAKEEAETADRMKSTFLATMSHELRTPMNGILGFTEVLLAGDLTDQAREQVEIIDSSGRSLLTLINDILDLSQIEAGKLKLRSGTFNLPVTVRNAVKLLQTKARDRNLGLVLHYDPRLPSHVDGDEDRIRQIVINLVGNALKFTEKGAVAIKVLPAGGLIRFEVRDTGIGIPEDKKASLFDRFSQIENGSTRRFEGSGLGLAICQELVAAMGGRIGCESAPGRGSCFFFEVPLRANEETVAIGADRPRTEEPAPRIVLIDDNPVSRDALRAMLACRGANVLACDDAGAGLDALSRAKASGHAVDGIILSDMMDGRSAHSFASEIEQDGLAAGARIVVVHAAAEGGLPGGDGSTFSLHQPVFGDAIDQAMDFILRREEDPRADLSEEREEADVVALSSIQRRAPVLIVDDVPANRMLVEAVLGKMGIETVTAENGAEAVRLAQGEAFGAILMDVYMPVMGGTDAARQIRREPGPNQATPIFALTASSSEEELRQAADCGMETVISKPIDFSILRALVLKALGRDNGARDPEGSAENPPAATALNPAERPQP